MNNRWIRYENGLLNLDRVENILKRERILPPNYEIVAICYDSNTILFESTDEGERDEAFRMLANDLDATRLG